jgi:hypothetical protein
MSICLYVYCECCVLSGGGLFDGLITGTWLWGLDNKEALPHWGPLPHGGNISLAVQIRKLLITQFSPVFCYLLLLRPKYLSHHPVPEHPQSNFTFMLPCCLVIDFSLNNQPDALIIPILFCYKTLHVSGIFSAHHQEFSTVHLALVSFIQVSDYRFQAESGWNCSSILTLLAYGHQKPAWNIPMPNVQ